VEKVGPQRFGIVAIDCAKARSKWMLCDFYGKVLVPPTEVEHARTQMQLATVEFKEACEQHGIRDSIVAVEMTGTYHRPIQRAFRKAGVETRLVHPFASKHYRLPAHGDNKTDDHDLERCLPGYAALFPSDDLWTRPVAMSIARHATSAEAIRQARIPGVTRWLREEKLRFQARTVEKIVAWSANAADADPLAGYLSRVWHPSRLDRSYVMDKLLTFHREHQTPPVQIVGDLQQAARQIPKRDHWEEAAPLQTIYERCRRSRRKGPQAIGTLLVAVLARLGVSGLESEAEAQAPIANVSDAST